MSAAKVDSMALWQSMVNSKTMTEEEVQKFYVSWSQRYDDDVAQLKTQGQKRLAERLAAFVPQEKRATFTVLDIAAGTGLVGHHLFELGFRIIDGVDMSREMLDKLEKRKIYRNVHCSLVGGGNKIETIADNKYDAVVISGGFAQSHMPCDSMREICRVIKPGGLYINNMTEYYLESVVALRELEPYMKQMEKEGVWKLLSRETEDAMLGGKTGVFHTFRKAAA